MRASVSAKLVSQVLVCPLCKRRKPDRPKEGRACAKSKSDWASRAQPAQERDEVAGSTC